MTTPHVPDPEQLEFPDLPAFSPVRPYTTQERDSALDRATVRRAVLQTKDFNLRLEQREKLSRTLIRLLLWQNTALLLVLLLTGFGFLTLSDGLIGTVISATLLETAYVIRKIVEFTFTEIDYKVRTGSPPEGEG